MIEFGGGSQDSVNELIGLYLKQTTEQLAQIRQALKAGQAGQAARVAHSCAGASSTCGMMAIVPLLRQLEQAGKTEDLPNAARLLESVTEEFRRIQQFVKDLGSSTASPQRQASGL